MEKPILFSGPMVRAILDGRKTQTRRIEKNPERLEGFMLLGEEPEWCPYGNIGDLLWVRETFRLFDVTEECSCYDDCSCARHHGNPVYKADNSFDESKWKPSIFMPKKYACGKRRCAVA